jgi:hypothetical protein
VRFVSEERAPKSAGNSWQNTRKRV